MYRQHTHDIYQGIHLYILLTIALLTALPAGAQTFRQVGTSDRLVNAIHRDATGYVWIGTGQTVDRYDGVRVKKYTIPGERLNLKRVTDITSGRDGTVYISNGEGVFRLPSGGSEIVPMVKNSINFPVNGLLLQGDTLFAATDQGVYLLSGDERHVERFMPRSDVLSANNVIKSLLPDPSSSDALWLSSRSSLMYLNLKERIFTEYPNASVNAEFTDMARIDNILYIATRGEGVLTFDTNKREWGPVINAGCNLVSAISAGPDDGLLNIATDGDGVYIYSARRRGMVNHLVHDRLAAPGESLSSNSVYSRAPMDRLLPVGARLYPRGRQDIRHIQLLQLLRHIADDCKSRGHARRRDAHRHPRGPVLSQPRQRAHHLVLNAGDQEQHHIRHHLQSGR